MGDITIAREYSRAVWIASWIDSLRQDIRYAFRTLRAQPAFTIATCTALVLGIGVNTSLFTFFNAVALRPWAVADAARVVTANYVHTSGGGFGTSGFGIAEYRYLSEHVRTFSGLIAWRQSGGRLGHEEVDRKTPFSYVSGNYFDVLGIRMVEGRGFLPNEDRAGSPQAVAVIGHNFWRRQFAGDPTAVGRTVRVDDVPFTIVGIAPAGFDGTDLPNAQSFWLPLASVQLLSADADYASSLLRDPNHCCSRLAGNARNMTSFHLPGEDEKQSRLIQVESVSPEYFSILSIPVLAGRQLDATDRPGGAITINEAMARRYWPDSNPVGQYVVFGTCQREIVGIVRDAHTTELGSVEPVYFELTAGDPSTRLLIRSPESDPAPRLRSMVNALDDRVAVQARPLTMYRDQSLDGSRAMALTAGVVGLLALLLASVGVFGVFSYVVHERTREIGIRMAIGARAPHVVRLMLASTAPAGLAGLAAGLLGSLLVSKFLTAQLYGVSRLDPTAYGIVAAVLSVAATLAIWFPARRATRIDPTMALRVE